MGLVECLRKGYEGTWLSISQGILDRFAREKKIHIFCFDKISPVTLEEAKYIMSGKQNLIVDSTTGHRYHYRYQENGDSPDQDGWITMYYRSFISRLPNDFNLETFLQFRSGYYTHDLIVPDEHVLARLHVEARDEVDEYRAGEVKPESQHLILVIEGNEGVNDNLFRMIISEIDKDSKK